MTLKETLLWPFTLPYGAAVHLRARAYTKNILKRRRLDGVVISVGNLTVGGTGKTPMVIHIAEHLIAEGKKVGILTRGYRGRAAAAQGTNSDSLNTTMSTSDEVRLLVSRLGGRAAFGIGADRFIEGSKLVEQGVNWFILDDGFQHLALERDVDIVLIDGTNPFGNGFLLPSGRLRETRSSLSRANLVVITRTGHAPAIEAAIRRDSDAPIFYARPALDSVRRASPEYPGAEYPDFQSQDMFAFCGIGNPAAFIADLKAWGIRVSGHRSFPDHHRYSHEDVDRIVREASMARSSAVICTEKDIFNLENWVGRFECLLYARISMQIDRENEFWQSLVSIAEAQRSARGLSPARPV
jgi:tetraacyldisaccharide 4'-kinase